MKSISSLILFFFCFLIQAYSNSTAKDSLLQIINHAPDDTSKVWALRDLAREYRYLSIDSMITYYQKALELSRQLKFTEGELSMMVSLSRRYQYKGEREKERAIILEALELAESENAKGWLVDIHIQLGKIHFRDLKHDAAYEAYLEAERILQTLENKYGLWIINYNLSRVFDAQDDLEKTEKYLKKAYDITKAKGIRKDFGWILAMQVEYYFRRKKWDRYTDVSEEYLQFLSTRKTPVASQNPHNLLFRYDDESPETIIQELETLIEHHKARSNELSLLETYTYLGNVKRQNKNYDGAIADYLYSISYAEKLDYKTSVADNYQAIYEIYETKQNFNAAYPYLKKYHHILDSLNTVDVQKNLSELEVKYETAKKDEALTQQKLELQQSAQTRKLITILALAGALIAAIALWFLYFKSKTNRLLQSKNEVIKKALNEKEILLKEIHHRVKNNLQVISSLLNWQSKYIQDDTALRSMQEGRNRVHSMALIHQNLYQTDNLTGIEVSDYIDKLGNSLFNSYKVNHDQVQFESQVEKLNLDVDTLIPLGLILNELLSNALKYAFPEGREGEIKVMLKKQNESLLLEVKDNGVGVPIEKQDKKTSDSFGYKLIEAFAEKLKAQLQIDHSYGTTVRLLIQNFKTV